MRLLSLVEKIYLRIVGFKKRSKYYRKLGVELGEDCLIFPEVGFGTEPYLVTLGNNVKITAGCLFITHDGGIEVLRKLNIYPNGDVFGKIIVGDNVFIGIRSIILPGVCIGNNVIIGAGSIVTSNIPANCVAAGVPARVIKTLDKYADDIRTKVQNTKGLNRKEKKEFLRNM
jgi:acetyltransferase-like isoleucine patch superfamily enzyme